MKKKKEEEIFYVPLAGPEYDEVILELEEVSKKKRIAVDILMARYIVEGLRKDKDAI